jgi:hypothetical protein
LYLVYGEKILKIRQLRMVRPEACRTGALDQCSTNRREVFLVFVTIMPPVTHAEKHRTQQKPFQMMLTYLIGLQAPG